MLNPTPILASGSVMNNQVVLAAVLSWLAAQSIKFAIGLRRRKKADFTYFVSTGGMPSAHSASVMGLAMSVGYETGFSSPMFGLALWFALIVMFDAQSVRRAAGEQAKILNQMVEELLQNHHLNQQKLAELLGHTPLQVGAGAMLGMLTAWLLQQV